MIVCGIDPGKTGALAFLRDDPRQLICVVPMPTVREPGARRQMTKRSVNWWAVTEAIREQDPDLIVIERQGARPGQGISSTFSIGYQYGALIGIASALGIPFEIVQPQVWKRGIGLLTGEKDLSRELAKHLIPEGAAFFTKQLDHGKAEACLIALWK